MKREEEMSGGKRMKDVSGTKTTGVEEDQEVEELGIKTIQMD